MPKRRKWAKIILVISLTFNLLIIGLVVGAGASGRFDHEQRISGKRYSKMSGLEFAPLIGALDRMDRRQLGDAIRKQRETLGEGADASKVYLPNVLATLRADPFQPDALLNQLDSFFEHQMQQGDLIRTLMVERISEMSPENRQAFADRVERKTKRHRRK